MHHKDCREVEGSPVKFEKEKWVKYISVCDTVWLDGLWRLKIIIRVLIHNYICVWVVKDDYKVSALKFYSSTSTSRSV